MPLDKSGKSDNAVGEIPSLRNLTHVYIADQIFKHDLPMLMKCYRLGTLPVRVVDALYCRFAWAALVKFRDAMDEPYAECAVKWVDHQTAKRNFKEAMEIAKNSTASRESIELYVRNAKKRMKEKADEHRDYSELYYKEYYKQTQILETMDKALTKEDREAMKAANPASRILDVHRRLLSQIVPAKTFFAQAPEYEGGERRKWFT